MGSSDRTVIKHKTELVREQAATLLEGLAAQIRAGTLDPQGLGLGLTPADAHRELPPILHVDLEVKDSPKTAGLKREIEVEIWWLEAPPITPLAGGDTTAATPGSAAPAPGA